MIRTIGTLKGYALQAIDGEIGSLEDLYFDDEQWAIRFFVVDTGKWLPGRKVLISPLLVRNIETNKKAFELNARRDVIEKSPEFDAHQPISQQHENKLFDASGAPKYWPPGPFLWSVGPYPGPVGQAEESTVSREIEAAEERKRREDRNLRSFREVAGYSIKASDGEIGHVEDFLIDDETWEVRYLVIDTRNWLPGRKVVISPNWVDSINWHDSFIQVVSSRNAIETSPEYDPAAAIGRDYEKKLHEHYHKPPYWESSKIRSSRRAQKQIRG
jgi:uncharacterized protein YrrD